MMNMQVYRFMFEIFIKYIALSLRRISKNQNGIMYKRFPSYHINVSIIYAQICDRYITKGKN